MSVLLEGRVRNCTEAGFGSFITSCVGTIPKGHLINTSSPGAKAFTVTATDKSGNRTSKTVHYTVKKKKKHKKKHHH